MYDTYIYMYNKIKLENISNNIFNVTLGNINIVIKFTSFEITQVLLDQIYFLYNHNNINNIKHHLRYTTTLVDKQGKLFLF